MIHAHEKLAVVVQIPKGGALVFRPVEPPAVDDEIWVGGIGGRLVHNVGGHLRY